MDAYNKTAAEDEMSGFASTSQIQHNRIAKLSMRLGGKALLSH